MKKIATKICLEKASENNSFQTEKLYLSGYDLEDLAENSSMAEIVFLPKRFGKAAVSSADWAGD